MSAPSLSLRLTGAHVLREGSLREDPIGIEDGRLTDAPLPEVDLSGYLVLPGIVDLHGDAFERHIAPRPSAPFPIATGLAAADRDAAAHGVTTAFLAQSWSWEGGVRGPDYAEDLLAALDDYRPGARIDLRAQIRCETHTVGTADRLIAAVKRHAVPYVIFNDHLPEALALAEARPEEIAAWAKKAGRTPEAHMALVHDCLKQKPLVPRHLCTLARAFDEMGVLYGSHDDPDALTREYYSMIGARVCEFPTAVSAAQAAQAKGDPVLMGAPNVVRGGSQAGNISALHLVSAGLCDALVSDYHYPALHLAAFRLADEGVLDLAQAWNLIAARPARILGLKDRGVIAEGRRADLVVLDATTRTIEGTIAGGRVACLSGQLAARFVTRPAPRPASSQPVAAE